MAARRIVVDDERRRTRYQIDREGGPSRKTGRAFFSAHQTPPSSSRNGYAVAAGTKTAVVGRLISSRRSIVDCRHSGMRLSAQTRNPETRHASGFRARAEPVIGPRFARTRWRAPEDKTLAA